MANEISFDEYLAKLKSAFANNGIAFPEDIELIELTHMEMLEAGTPVDEFVEKMVAEYKG